MAKLSYYSFDYQMYYKCTDAYVIESKCLHVRCMLRNSKIETLPLSVLTENLGYIYLKHTFTITQFSSPMYYPSNI